VVGVAIADMEVIEKNLEGLAVNIPDAMVDELPRHYQHNTVGISTCIGRLLCRVEKTVVFYNEQYPL
jgi:hypothetical protein